MTIAYVGVMKHGAHISKPVADMSEDEFTEWLSALPPAPGIRHVDDGDDEDDARAEADIAAGRFYPHSVVARWLKTWGTPDRKSFDEWLKSSG